MILVKPKRSDFFAHFWFKKQKLLGFMYIYSNSSVGNIGKKMGLSVAERAKIATVNKVGYLGRQISKKLKLRNTAIHQAIVIFRNFVSFQDLHWSGSPRVTSQRDNYLIKWMVVRSLISSNWVGLVAQR